MATIDTYFRKPLPGESVKLVGSRHRPQLNGAVGEVVASTVDDEGRILVRLAGVSGRADAQPVRIHLNRLRPIRSASASELSPLPPASELAWQAPSPKGPAASALSASSPPGLAASALSKTRPTPPSPSSRGWGSALGVEPPKHARGSALASSLPPSSQLSLARSTSLSTSSLAALRTVQGKQRDYVKKFAAWKQSCAAIVDDEKGDRIHWPLPGTDATSFDQEFLKQTGGVPMHKCYPKEDVVLRHPKLGTPCPPWAP